MNFKSLNTQNYILEKFKLSDVDKKYFNWLKDKRNSKYLTNHKFGNIFELKRYVSENFMNDNSLFLKILTKKLIHVGNLRIHDINKKKLSAFLGIMVGEENQKKKSIAQNVIHHISKFLFTKYQISKIYLGVDRKNKSAVNAYLKSGFIFHKKNKNLMVRDYFVTKLCIGTAQFGSHYGIANQTGIVKMHDIKKIKKFALSNGIRTIDTARSYGLNAEGEKRLANVGIEEFTTLAKLPVSKPDKDRVSWVIKNIKESLKNLNLKTFNTVFVHNVNFLFDAKGNKIYEGLIKAKKIGLIKNIGVSTYTIEEIKIIIKKFKKINVIMLPFNLFDQRPLDTKILEKLAKLNIEIYARSTFLQGLILIDHKKIPKKFNKWQKKFKTLDSLSKKLKMKKYEICLRYVLSNPYLDKVVVGSDNFTQLKKLIIIAKKGCIKINIREFKSNNEINLINPSRWPSLK